MMRTMGIRKLWQRVCPIDRLRPTNSDLTFDSLSCSAYNTYTLYFHFQRGTESSFGRQLFDAARKSSTGQQYCQFLVAVDCYYH